MADLRSYVELTIEKNGKQYYFSMPLGAPYGEAYDAAFEVLHHLVEMSKENLKRLEEASKAQE